MTAAPSHSAISIMTDDSNLYSRTEPVRSFASYATIWERSETLLPFGSPDTPATVTPSAQSSRLRRVRSATGPISISVRWPTGKVQRFKDIPVNHRVEIEESKLDFHARPFENRIVP